MSAKLFAGIGGHHYDKHPGRSDTWLTPPDIIADLGPFDLDPCAAPDPRPWPTAREHWTQDGLTREWSGRVWLNPPYSRKTIGEWLRKMAVHRSGLALTFARTDTDAFQRYVLRSADALYFFSARISFHHPDGRRSTMNSGGPSVLAAYGANDAERLWKYATDPRGTYRRKRPGTFVKLR